MTDDDDICAYPTAEDTPCQHPAGENGRCHIPQHNPDGGGIDAGGRDFAIDEDDHDALLDAARDGLSKAGCARAAGTTRDSLRRYLEAHPEFRAEFAQARARGERHLVANGLEGEVDPSMAKFLLSTSFDYVEKKEIDADVTHDGDLLAEFE